MIRVGPVVQSIALIWVKSSEPATAGARFIVSERGEILSPKYAPEITKPAVTGAGTLGGLQHQVSAGLLRARLQATFQRQAYNWVGVGTTDGLAMMLADVRLVVPATSDAKWSNPWIDDWEIHLADRRDFADRLRTKGRSQEFLETVKYDTQISKSLDHYADINKMLSCQTPGDV